MELPNSINTPFGLSFGNTYSLLLPIVALLHCLFVVHLRFPYVWFTTMKTLFLERFDVIQSLVFTTRQGEARTYTKLQCIAFVS